MAWSRDGVIATGDSDGDDQTLRLWDAVTGRPLGEPTATPIGYVYAVKWSPNGELLAAGGTRGVHLWQSATETEVCRWAVAALGQRGLQALTEQGGPHMRCLHPESIIDLPPLTAIPVGGPD